ncbi:hypothetical protein [Gymnodinialimonas ceratoperidinii]|uniref:Uncharacterized protein n=1 Tax=Gymnodinialimonas ceratoperidinii TaxID=2856823 RepID=A0A8F6Y903_9RHOB|nr:hypothetical protein [Gymnodinialimonas ceratoperidinii]QXT38439.1 hypothetical protein KYE46_10820 [Gymnodinialimonas ceratoperidinii]
MSSVTRRHVLYIPGFDPVPPRAYRERYRREALRQAEISGFDITQSSAADGARFGWHVDARMEGVDVSVDLEVLYWADIVRAGMAAGVWATYRQMARTAWIYISMGALFRLMRLRKGPVIAALYPVAVLLGQAVLAMAIVACAAWGGVAVGGWPFGLVAGLLGLAGAVFFLRWCARRDHLLAWYLMKDYAFSARLRGAYPPEQEARMAEFADRIAEVLQGDVDEALVVGHSSGAYIAISVLADLIRAGRLPADGPTLSLLTLGHVVPMVSFLPDAHRLRRDLAFLAGQDVAWVDVSAPGDGCAFALCDPVAVTGVAPAEKRGPLVISAAFTQTLSAARRQALKWQLFELHFQYLNAFDNLPDSADAYDYFRVTAGPMTLGGRFAGRAASASRIETPVNGYTDT